MWNISQILNETDTGLEGVSSYCWNWCQEQHFINEANNLTE